MNQSLFIQKINAYERLMRLDRPIGILLLLWPTLWALLIAGKGQPDWVIVLVFITGTVLMRSAGCVLNDIADRDFDGKVERTKNRPLAQKIVTVKEAYLLAAVLVICAFVLVCFLNKMTIVLSFAALFVAASYPYTKRFIVIPQAYLGIAFGFGILMAFTALNAHIPIAAYLLFVANIFWAIAYDTEYAMVDRDDDVNIGIHSSAIWFGRYDVLAIMLCYACMLGLLSYLGWMLDYGYYYFAGLLVALLMVVWQYYLIRYRDKANCFKAFLQNTWIGFVITLGIAAELLLKI